MMNFDYSKIADVELCDLSHDPDYWCDTYVMYATYEGREMSDAELEALSEDQDFMHEKIMEELY